MEDIRCYYFYWRYTLYFISVLKFVISVRYCFVLVFIHSNCCLHDVSIQLDDLELIKIIQPSIYKDVYPCERYSKFLLLKFFFHFIYPQATIRRYYVSMWSKKLKLKIESKLYTSDLLLIRVKLNEFELNSGIDIQFFFSYFVFQEEIWYSWFTLLQ